jgi:hypothetical protein
MAAKPVVTSSDGTWGTELNAFLDVGHNTDGTLKVELLQMEYASTTTTKTTTDTLVGATTAFTSSDGVEVLTKEITGLTVGSRIKIEVSSPVAVSDAATAYGAIFVDSVATAISTFGNDSDSTAGGNTSLSFFGFYTATATSHTFKFRVVGASGTTTVNNCFGGEGKTLMCITEYAA